MKNLELLNGIFGDNLAELTEDHKTAINEKLEKLIETRVDSKVKFQVEVAEAEAKEKYDTLLNETVTKYDEQVKIIESKTVDMAKTHKSKLEKQVKELSEQVTAQKNKEVESFKKTIVEKLDKYLEMELDKKVPETYVESVAQVSVLQPIVEGFKKVMEDNYVKFDEDNFGLLKDAREEIIKLREDHAKVVNESMDLTDELKTLKRSAKISEVCEGLTDTQRERATTLLETYDSNEISERFDAIRDFIIEGYSSEEETSAAKEEETGVEESSNESPAPADTVSKGVEESEAEDEDDVVSTGVEEGEEEAPSELSEQRLIESWAKEYKRQVGLK